MWAAPGITERRENMQVTQPLGAINLVINGRVLKASFGEIYGGGEQELEHTAYILLQSV